LYNLIRVVFVIWILMGRIWGKKQIFMMPPSVIVWQKKDVDESKGMGGIFAGLIDTSPSWLLQQQPPCPQKRKG